MCHSPRRRSVAPALFLRNLLPIRNLLQTSPGALVPQARVTVRLAGCLVLW